MINIALVDDDDEMRNKLASYIKKHEKECHLKFEVSEFKSAAKLLENYTEYYNIIFMDIQMEGIGGIEAAEKIREMDKDVILIFVTNMPNYVITGYRVNALGYLLKPVSYVDFIFQLQKSTDRLEAIKNHYILVESAGEFIRIDLSQVMYIESSKHKVLIYTEKDAIEIYSSLKKLETILSKYYFARCNNCYLVNLRYVKKIAGSEVFFVNSKLTISRAKKGDFMKALTDYIGGENYEY